jgi:hypothetical protein
MISLLQRSLRYIFDSTIAPHGWTLDEPIVRSGEPTINTRWQRTMTEIPALQVRIAKDSQPGYLESQYILQYRANFKFPGNLGYDQIPMRQLNNILEYLVFIIQTHPDLLTKTPERINAVLGWGYNTDPCPYPNPPSDPVATIQDKLTVRDLLVNAFVPVVEVAASQDWVVTLVWSIEVGIYGSVNAYRDYFAIVFDPNNPNNPYPGNSQITPQPNLTGGVRGLPMNLITIGLHNDANLDQSPLDKVTAIVVPKP